MPILLLFPVWFPIALLGSFPFPPLSILSWLASTSLLLLISAFLCFYYSLNSPPHALNKLYSILYHCVAGPWGGGKGCLGTGLTRHPFPPHLTTPLQNISFTSLSFHNHNTHPKGICSSSPMPWMFACLTVLYPSHVFSNTPVPAGLLRASSITPLT